ncbi:MAG: hypothetical protein IE933_14330 [Sphingomonadales bacterium]|nr:hypothetical protein [Sphingomonadales bacterium]MBD3775230.1 hypothetical protein [Paracoccaceae bacterium]
MTRAIPTLLALTALAAVATGAATGADAKRQRDLPPRANPGEVVATELAFARAAQDEGQWTAFADYATKDAVMFVPEPVNAQEWLKKRANPEQAVKWQPHKVWSSCDGSLAVTKGAWQRPDGSVGYFTTVWERQKKGEYRWVLDRGDALQTPLPEPEMIAAEVATCNGKRLPDLEGNVNEAEPFYWQRVSRDGSLAVRIGPGLDGAHLTISFVSPDGPTTTEPTPNPGDSGQGA